MIRLNVGGIDRLLRIVVGLVLMIATAATYGSWHLDVQWGIVTGAIGFVLFITGVMAWCPIYFIAKFSTHHSIFESK